MMYGRIINLSTPDHSARKLFLSAVENNFAVHDFASHLSQCAAGFIEN